MPSHFSGGSTVPDGENPHPKRFAFRPPRDGEVSSCQGHRNGSSGTGAPMGLPERLKYSDTQSCDTDIGP
jgi:hypothetical protein